jgi:hypothetical protein
MKIANKALVRRVMDFLVAVLSALLLAFNLNA